MLPLNPNLHKAKECSFQASLQNNWPFLTAGGSKNLNLGIRFLSDDA